MSDGHRSGPGAGSFHHPTHNHDIMKIRDLPSLLAIILGMLLVLTA
ncbi:MAG: hypothetical protein ACREVV_02125 [Steroidobacteraceae bacterium]